MLNGLYPVIVLQKVNFAKINVAGKTISLPIPVYLDENLTGIALMSQSRRVEFASDSIVACQSNDAAKDNTLKVKQRGITNGVDIVLKASRDSIGMNLLLPIADIAFQRAAKDEYFISYFNRNIILFKSKLAHFSTDESASDTSVTINISLIKEDKPPEEKEGKKLVLQNSGNALKAYAK
jgi:hypothetical protein